jgi:Periplasmic copper-binding protein (NosD)
VANNGLDSPACGAKSEPCRSISTAIDLAQAGDRVRVGPGVYGDLDADGDFDDDGEENAEQGFGCECMVNLLKPIKLESIEGASSTIIDVGFPILGQIIAVYISADDVSFGSRDKGFHVTSREFATAAASGSPRALAGVAVDDQAVRAKIRGNLVTKAIDGFVIAGSGADAKENTAANNARNGFLINGDGHLLRENTSINNIGEGFTIIGSDHTIILNSAYGNRTCGIGFNSGELDTPSVIMKNNIFGNGTLVPALDNCGLSNTSFQPLAATGNFWGADTGPGQDPADEVLGNINNTTVFPVAEKPFPVRGFE